MFFFVNAIRAAICNGLPIHFIKFGLDAGPSGRLEM